MVSTLGLLSISVGLALWGTIGLVAKYLLVPRKNWHRVKLVDAAVISFIMFVPAVLASGVILIALAIFFNALDVKAPDSVILIMVAPVYPYLIFLVLSDS